MSPSSSPQPSPQPEPRQASCVARGALRAGLALGLALIVVAAFGLSTPAKSGDAPAKAPPISASPLTGDAIVLAAEAALPAVVNISSTKVSPVDRHPFLGPFFEDPFFRDFFGNRQQPPGGMPQERRERSRGSGVIVGSNGIVITNNHVVEGAQAIEVALSDGREFEAELLGSDPRSDVAVLQLKNLGKTELKFLHFGDSDALRLGETVVAVGNPFGLEGTVTMGIVSAKGRADVGIVDYEDFIQTDAAINPGNSGGALVNLRGELIGINTAIASRSGGYQGIGFAIPSNMARRIMDSLLKDGRVARGWLGVLIQDLRPEMAAAFEATDESGVLIGDVVPDSPADRAGLKRGDVLTSLNGRALNSASELRNQVGMMKPGEKVRLALLREGKNRELGLKLGELPDTREEAVAAASRGSLDGLRLGPLDAQNRARFEVPNSVGDGLVVVEIVPGSAAAEAGLRPGDVILEVARKAVRTLEDVESQWENSPGKILLLVSRGGNTMYLMVSPS